MMRKYQISLLLVLMFITLFVFYPVLKSDFVNFDDKVLITNNWKIQSLAADNLKAMLFKPHVQLYHPLVNISFALEYRLFGPDPYIFHAVNLVLHLFNTLFVFFIFFSLTKRNFFISLVTAFIFACHPVHVEAVAWISGRKDTLCAFFFLASLTAYLKMYDKPENKNKLYLLSLFLFVCACLAKSVAVTLPAVLILVDWFSGKGFDRKNILKYLPFFALTIVFSVITYAYYSVSYSQNPPMTGYTLFNNFIAAHFNILFYLGKFLIPSKLAVLYPYFYPANTVLPAFIMKSPVLLYGLALLIIYSLKYSKKIFFGFAFFIITISPAVNILPTGMAPVADRYAYIPLIGLGYIVAVIIVFVYNKFNRKIVKTVFSAAVCVLLVFMCSVSNAQVKVWNNTKTLFDHQIETYPGQVAHAYASRGVYFYELKMYKEAEKDYLNALFINPQQPYMLFSYANLKKAQGKNEEALKLYEAVPPGEVNLSQVYANSIDIYEKAGNTAKADDMISVASKLGERFSNIDLRIGIVYANRGDFEKAVSFFERSKIKFPKEKDAYVLTGKIYELLNDAVSAENEYMEGIAACGAETALLYRLGILYFLNEQYEKAEEIFGNIAEKNQNAAAAYDYLGNIYAIKGAFKNAMIQYTMAVLAKNDFALPYFHRAVIHYEEGRYDKAYEDAKRAGELGFNVPENFKKELKQKSGYIL